MPKLSISRNPTLAVKSVGGDKLPFKVVFCRLLADEEWLLYGFFILPGKGFSARKQIPCQVKPI